MEIRRLCSNKEFYYQVLGIKTKMPYFKNVKYNGRGSFICCGSTNGKDWEEGLLIGEAFKYIRNPFSIMSDNRIVTQNDKGEWGVLDYFGRVIVPYGVYAKIDGFKSRLARVKKLNTVIFWEKNEEGYYDTFGIIDINGKIIVECIYDEIYKFYNTDSFYTILRNGNHDSKFHLAYRMIFSLNDIEYLQYQEEHGSISRWDIDYFSDAFKYTSLRAKYIDEYNHLQDEDEDDYCDNSNYSTWDSIADAFEDNEEAAAAAGFEW